MQALDERAYRLSNLDVTEMGGNARTYEQNLSLLLKDKFIDVDDFLTLKNLDKKSNKYKALLQEMYLKQKEYFENMEKLNNFNIGTQETQAFLDNYKNQIATMSEQQLINERKRLLTMPLFNDNMRLINMQTLESLEAFMYPNRQYFQKQGQATYNIIPLSAMAKNLIKAERPARSLV